MRVGGVRVTTDANVLWKRVDQVCGFERFWREYEPLNTRAKNWGIFQYLPQDGTILPLFREIFFLRVDWHACRLAFQQDNFSRAARNRLKSSPAW